MNYRLIIYLILSFSLISCETVIENIAENIEYDNYKSPYAGTYLGTYSGSDSGTLKIVIDAKDIVTVTRHSSTFKIEESFFGGMVGTSFYRVNSEKSGFSISGNLTSQTKTFTGNWSQNGISGTWSVTKQ